MPDPHADQRHAPHTTGLMIQRFPPPPRRFLAADKRPHFVQLSFFYLAEHHGGWCSFTSTHKSGGHRVKRRGFFLRVVITVVGLTPSTRAVSRMPLPLERHVDHLLLNSQLPPHVVILSQKDSPPAVWIITQIPLLAIGLPSVFYDLRTSTRRTLHCDNRHTPPHSGD